MRGQGRNRICCSRISIFLYHQEHEAEAKGPSKRRSEMNDSQSWATRYLARTGMIAASFLVLCASGVCQDKSKAQTPAPQQEPPSVLKVTTRLVTVDVVARDRHGNAV